MDTRRLASFVKVVDVGSVTGAAHLLRLAQPALSQQMAGLEAEFRRPLLIRGPRGVVPTAAGRVLYRHAQAILRQMEEARRGVAQSDTTLEGTVSVGLAPFSTATQVALPLLRQLRRQHPGVVLHVRDYFGTVLSELLVSGRLNMAVLYGRGPIHGVRFLPLFDEAWFLVGTPALLPEGEGPLPVEALARLELLLPVSTTFLRGTVEAACARAGFLPRVVAELESTMLLAGALAEGIGATVLPWSMAMALGGPGMRARRLVSPDLTAPLSLCVPEAAAPTGPAAAVQALLLAEINALAWAGSMPAAADGHRRGERDRKVERGAAPLNLSPPGN